MLASFTKPEVTFGGNESARLATAQAIVEQGAFSIDESAFETVDRVKLDGRFYSNKPLLLSLWLAALYTPLHHLGGLDFANARAFLIETLTLFGITSFSLLLTVLFQARLRERGMPLAPACALSLAVVFSTWIWSFGTTVNNHTPAAALVFAFAMALERCERSPSRRRAFGTGALGAVLMGVAIPVGAIFSAVGGATLVAARRTGPVVAYVAGFAAVAVLLACVNLAAYGDPRDAYWIPGAFDFPESVHAPGLAGLRRPENGWSYAFHLTVGLRGVFSHMPALALGIAYLAMRRGALASRERWIAAGVLVLFVFYATRTGIFGGWAYGFRFLVPVIPILFWWASLWWLESMSRARTAVLTAGVAVGLFTSWVGTLNPWPVAYEGAATQETAVEYYVRSPLRSNLMVWSFERDPDGAAFRWLSSAYTRQIAGAYLETEFANRRRPDLVERAARWRARDTLPEREGGDRGAH